MEGMIPTESPVPAGAPVLMAWEAYKATPEYANTRKWAAHEAHVDGSLWAAFYQGFMAGRRVEEIRSGQFGDDTKGRAALAETE